MAKHLFQDGAAGPVQVGLDRLFFAVVPDEYAAQQADRFRQRLCSEHGLTGTQVRPEHFHVTLHHLGDHASVPAEILALAERVAHGVHSVPFEVGFDDVASLPAGGARGAAAIVLTGGEGLDKLRSFQGQVGAAMAEVGLKPWLDGHFTPHMTLVHDPAEIERESMRPITWTVRELLLVHSTLGQSRHNVIGRWPLLGPRLARTAS